ncbi:hypothetical protein Caka_0997 [Coraliomargarita akajimensis DSM 45221]|uniref:Uncharacterized protein n=1 Tax=Coraliomargarita akajimensis (strain DSM 45221 / IAM 15411 / JCM 23193 / KCTC 12865 / 04OKA010-24) TaxID=583355 RepID=D5ER26_CORAD|nr:hypothetical protein Caka_0997 [Coraliomargarita akajimensis DSM 45221]
MGHFITFVVGLLREANAEYQAPTLRLSASALSPLLPTALLRELRARQHSLPTDNAATLTQRMRCETHLRYQPYGQTTGSL